MRRATPWVLLLATATASGVASGQARRPERVVLSSGAVSIHSLPVASLPAPYSLQTPPAKVAEEDPPELVRKTESGPKFSVWRKTRQTPQYIMLTGTDQRPLAFEGSAGQSMVRVVCGAGSYGVPFTPVRWMWSKPGAGVEVVDAWLETATCNVGGVRRRPVSAAPLVTVEGVPIVLGFRDADEGTVTLLFPPGQSIAAESLGRPLIPAFGAFSRVDLPSGRGAGASTAMGFHPQQSPGWAPMMGGEKPATWDTNEPGVEVSIEIAGTVADAAPTMSVRVETQR
jgi:hypothetical protein